MHLLVSLIILGCLVGQGLGCSCIPQPSGLKHSFCQHADIGIWDQIQISPNANPKKIMLIHSCMFNRRWGTLLPWQKKWLRKPNCLPVLAPVTLQAIPAVAVPGI